MTSWRPCWKCGMAIQFDSLMHIQLKNNSGIFHPNPLWNDGALGFFDHNNKMTRCVATWDQFLIQWVRTVHCERLIGLPPTHPRSLAITSAYCTWNMAVADPEIKLFRKAHWICDRRLSGGSSLWNQKGCQHKRKRISERSSAEVHLTEVCGGHAFYAPLDPPLECDWLPWCHGKCLVQRISSMRRFARQEINTYFIFIPFWSITYDFIGAIVAFLWRGW